MPLTLLAVGDLHLGRRPGGLPDDLRGREQARALGPAEVLQRLVQRAIDDNVNVVALAGDLVESENDFFEAYRDLYLAVSKLVKAGIQVVGVAGNHDVKVLPRLADELPAFQLLGRSGTWQACNLSSPDGTKVTLHGWSFPQSRVTLSPLANHRFTLSEGLNLGLLHCDRDQHASYHAPVSSTELHNSGMDAWLLGHIHKPDALSLSAPSGYLGSVSALRRTETGSRGPWLYTLGNKAIEQIEHWSLAPLRWEEITLSVTGLEKPEDITGLILESIRQRVDKLGDLLPDCLGLSLIIEGRTRHRQAIARILDSEQVDNIPVGSLRTFIGSIRYDLKPDIDLVALAKEQSPAGLLASRLLILNTGTAQPQRQELIHRTREKLEPITRESAWHNLSERSLTDERIIHWLRQSLSASLDQLLQQQESS